MGSLTLPLSVHSQDILRSWLTHTTTTNHINPSMENYLEELTNEVITSGLATKGVEGLPCPTHLMLGVLVTLLPKLVPRMLPYFMGNQQLRERFSNEDYIAESEQIFRDKFTENLRMVEDIVNAAENNSLEKKSKEFTGFKKFLFGSLEALDINVSDYIGGLEVESLQRLARVANGEDSMSGLYNIIADTIMAVGTFIYRNYLQMH